MLIYTRINAPSAGRVARIAAMCCALGLISGCATTIPIRATAYDVQVQLDPSTHTLEGRTTLQVRLDTEDVPDDRPVAIELTLNGALDVRDVAAENVRITGHSVRKHKSKH